MKINFFPFLFAGLCCQLAAQNPITPPGVYFPDPSAKVWEGKLYLYGSLDESTEYWCSRRHHVLETSDMRSWIIHEDVFSSIGENDEVPYNDNLLFAPDCGFRNDTFYLYYCQPSNTEAEGVAVSTSPVGPFRDGKPMDLGEHQEIDPSVFMDDDGQAYYIWGQFNLKMAKLQADMRNIEKSSIMTHVLTEKEHYFHEGAFMTKRNGLYYLVYADFSRGEQPTCIGYATSKSAMGPYEYGGVIIDNDECNPGNWNNHGSIAEFQDQWYVFYHRSSHGARQMRRVCLEPIEFNDDGTIDEVVMTSQGAAGPFKKGITIEAEYACILLGDVRVQAFEKGKEELGKISDGDKALFRYVAFSGKEKKIVMRVKAGEKPCTISLALDKPWHRKIAELEITPGDQDWQVLEFSIDKTKGTYPLYLLFHGEGDNLCSIDWLKFE